ARRERACGTHVAARGAPHTEVDAPGEERFQHAELFGDLERRIVREHHAAGANTDVARPSGHLADEDLGAGRGEAAGGVVLGEPVAPVAETVTQLGQLECLLDGLYWRAALPDRRLIEDGKGEVAHAAASSPF